MLSKVALLAVLAALAQGNPLGRSLQARQKACNGDNLLNRFRGAQHGSQAKEFCAIFIAEGPYVTATITTAAEAIPTDLATARSYPSPLFNTRFPMTYMEQRLSSACGCISYSTVTRTRTNWIAEVTPATTTASGTSSSSSLSPSSTSSGDASPASASSSDASSTSISSTSTASSTSTPSVPADPAPTHNCWKEPEGKRALSDLQFNREDMSVESCAALCQGYKYYAVEYSSECFCGNELASAAFPVGSASECNMPCKGKPDEMCGGSSRLNLYTAEGPAYSAPGRPSASEVTGAFVRQGCYAESQSRVLAYSWGSDSMTRETCIYSCAINGASFSGLQYGRECWCGNQMANAAQLSDDKCALPSAMPCFGDKKTACGGEMIMEIFAKAA